MLWELCKENEMIKVTEALTIALVERFSYQNLIPTIKRVVDISVAILDCSDNFDGLCLF